MITLSQCLIAISLVFLICFFQVFEYVTTYPSQGRHPHRPNPEIQARYVLIDEYRGEDFFDGFNFEDAPDPTHGHVVYQGRPHAISSNLSYIGNDGIAYIQTDFREKAPLGRKSVRISTKKSYTRGIFVLDAVHMPQGCGVWPAFWTTAIESWPNKGEIDILEGVNLETDNAFTLHTGPGCRMARYRKQKGNSESMDCDVKASNQWPNQGCGVKTPESFGSAFNQKHGGVVVMQWTEDVIRTWIFDRGVVPFDVSVDAPQPDLDVTKWGLPDATFDSINCNIAEIFRDHVIIINVRRYPLDILRG